MKNSSTKNVKKVLIVDDEELFLASLKEGLLLFAEEFTVLTAQNGRRALEILQRQDIELVVTDLKMPEMDGYQLLLEMIAHYPHIPVIVMTAFGTPDIEREVQSFEVFDYLEKPIELNMLADKIRVGINKSTDGHLKGIMIYSFLQLLQLERKTCVLKVTAEEKTGILCFHKGELIDGVYGELVGEEAAFEIISWDEAEIEIVSVTKKMQHRIKRPLPNILMEAAQRKDEFVLHTETLEIPNSEPALGIYDEFEVYRQIPMPDLLNTRTEETKNFTADSAENSSPPADPSSEIKHTTHKKKELTENMANNINQSLDELMGIDGAMAVALVDSSSGMALGAIGSGVNLDVAAAGNTEVVKSKQKVMQNLGLDDKIEDILITLGQQYHLIRPLNNHKNLFFYLVLGRDKSNLAMARFKLSDVEARVQL